MPLSAGMLVKKCSKASNPPAEAPMPTTWKVSLLPILAGDAAGRDSDWLALRGAPERAGLFCAEGFRLSIDPAFFRLSPMKSPFPALCTLILSATPRYRLLSETRVAVCLIPGSVFVLDCLPDREIAAVPDQKPIL
jgi:hypothetical protein